jgi:hypothetical protein
LKITAGIGFVFALVVAGEASAQTLTAPQKREMTCVYDALAMTRQAPLVAQSYLSETTANGFRGRADAALESAARECASDYAWDDAVRGLAVAIGTMSATADFLGDELKAAGVSEDAVAKIAGLKPGLSKRDVELLLDGGWGDDRAFLSRMRTKLKGIGVPDDAVLIQKSVKVLETAVIGADFTKSFVEAQFS